jgi:UDP-2,4-diacetamido-2,4,6-trideoxy-beta-L-altropyranose hydrolase
MVIENPTIVFRVDAGLPIGSGHLMRCLSLAAALRDLGARSHLVCRAHDGHLGTLVEAQGHTLHLLPRSEVSATQWLGADWATDAAQTLQATAGLRPDWLVVDHYGLDARWEQAVGQAVGQCLAIDDLADRPHAAAWLLDQNLQSRAGRYDGRLPSGARRLLGPRFALLRPEFARLRAVRRSVGSTGLHRVLAFAGGIDATDLLPKVVRAWQQLATAARPRLDLVIGASSPNLEPLRALCAEQPGCTLHVQTDEMAQLMSSCDLMITAAGSVNWERCCLGIPALVCATADNQHGNLRELVRCRTAIGLGDARQLDEPTLTTWLARLSLRPGMLRPMGERAARLVDGLGARRVAIGMLSRSLRLRRATQDDARPALAWRNAESTRRHFTDPRPIDPATHLAWWQATLADPQRALLVAEVGGSPIGVLRLDRDGDAAVVSIYLDPALTGIGLGTQLLKTARRWVAGELPPVRRLLALILPANRASEHAFAEAGFVPGEPYWRCGV